MEEGGSALEEKTKPESRTYPALAEEEPVAHSEELAMLNESQDDCCSVTRPDAGLVDDGLDLDAVRVREGQLRVVCGGERATRV